MYGFVALSTKLAKRKKPIVQQQGFSERTRAQSANWPEAKAEVISYTRCCAFIILS